MKHALVALADKIDGTWLDEQLAARFSDKGRPAEPVRFMISMFLLKHTYALSDEQVRECWVHDPYFQYFTGALKKSDLARVTIDTTVQPKNVAFPTAAKLLEAAIRQLGKLARKQDVPLRPRQAIQADEPANQVPAHPPRPDHPLYPA